MQNAHIGDRPYQNTSTRYVHVSQEQFALWEEDKDWQGIVVALKIFHKWGGEGHNYRKDALSGEIVKV